MAQWLPCSPAWLHPVVHRFLEHNNFFEMITAHWDKMIITASGLITEFCPILNNEQFNLLALALDAQTHITTIKTFNCCPQKTYELGLFNNQTG